MSSNYPEYETNGEPQPASTVVPRRLELSINPQDGSLLTAPLLSVLLAATDGLYTDLYAMAHGELEVTSFVAPQLDPEEAQAQANNNIDLLQAQQAEQQQQQQHNNGNGGGAAAAGLLLQRKEKMSNLSFAQRRHELAWRMATHGKTLTHVAALTASAASPGESTSSSSDLATATQVSTKALQHTRTAWVQADEAQDALYFFHARLFPARQAPSDVYGAMDTMLAGGAWPDLPMDLQLTVDRYDNSKERQMSAGEVKEQWQISSVRDKLLRGEVGWMRQQQILQQQQLLRQPQLPQKGRTNNNLVEHVEVPWTVSLRGGIVRLTHGRPKVQASATSTSVGGEDTTNATTQDNNKHNLIYPIEAVLTVLSTAPKAEWTLLSINVHAQAKTGESNHQLDTTNRQRYDLHRLSALAMSKEEARQRREENAAAAEKDKSRDMHDNDDDDDDAMETTTTNDNNDDDDDSIISSIVMARPLDALFHVAHTFQLSWQLEILSAQAQALRKGLWATTSNTQVQNIVVTPVQFLDTNHDSSSNILGFVSISFWSVDDRYGPPCMGDLSLTDNNDKEENLGNNEHDNMMDKTTTTLQPSVTNQLTLSVRAEAQHGIRVSISGAASVMEFATVQPHIQSTIRELMEATSNPFALSASEALLAATRLCAERKCFAVVHALTQQFDNNTTSTSSSNNSKLPPILPHWIVLQVERGSIAVAARISYHGVESASSTPVVLFRLACDARTGSFVPTYSRSARLLQLLACNDLKASESTALRIASLARSRRRGAGISMTGRAVRDAFDGLSRSMNVLGQRTGVGGAWKDTDDMSASLRQRAIHVACGDVRVSLITCCGMASIYGLSALAIGVATGVAASPDM
jgi:hypothetical protein